jgi:hypothetical protein
MIRPASAADRDSRGTKRVKRLKPCLEDRPGGIILLEIDAYNPPGAIIQIEVAR